MPWLQVTLMSQRKEFVKLAMVDGANLARLCQGFNISRKTGYKWLARFLGEGEAGLFDRGRRPRASPWVTPPAMEEAVLRVREAHPAWGGRKIRARLQTQGWVTVPAASTITAILRRHGCIDPAASRLHRPGGVAEAPGLAAV